MKNKLHTQQTKFFTVALWGIASVGAYGLLYMFSDTIIAISKKVHEGEKMAALTPITIAFTFSIIHGNFTSHFWEFLGFTARKK